MSDPEQFVLDPNGVSPGFAITFASGCAISVRFGVGNYCDNRSFDAYASYSQHVTDRLVCPNAEVAIITADGQVMDPEGWVVPAHLPEVIALVAAGRVDEAHVALSAGSDGGYDDGRTDPTAWDGEDRP